MRVFKMILAGLVGLIVVLTGFFVAAVASAWLVVFRGWRGRKRLAQGVAPG